MMNDELQFSALDRQFGRFVERLHGGPAPQLREAAMLVSRRRAEGHICIPVQELPASSTVGSGDAFTPLVLDCGRLYLRRYWEYEQQLARAILARAATAEKLPKRREADWQQVAAENALARNFSVITGGPGTGKTHTVRAILRLLREQSGGAELKIALAAPTGKAAARLSDALRGEATEDATTIHRLLGTIPDSPYFRHNAERPLTADVVIVDEASMVDLALMTKLVEAVPLTSKLILLGDRDQLASVEAGNVLADICAAAESEASPLHGAVVQLRKNYRFASTGGIYTLSTAVNAGDADGAIAALQRVDDDEVRWEKLPVAADLSRALHDRIVTGYRAYLQAADPVAALEQLQRFRILCAVRHGPFGVENLNSLAEEALTDTGLLTPRAGWYAGRPVIITRNDHNLQLFNGDSGIILPDAEAGGELRAFFLSPEGRLRRFLPSRLPQHETAFALTVHKSQGSEFEKLLLILPEKDAPVLTRELLYTGITRARQAVELWADESLIRAAVSRRTERTSGLRDALWRPAERKQLHQAEFGF